MKIRRRNILTQQKPPEGGWKDYMTDSEFLKILDVKLTYLPRNQKIKEKIINLLNEALFGEEEKSLPQGHESLLRYGLKQ